MNYGDEEITFEYYDIARNMWVCGETIKNSSIHYKPYTLGLKCPTLYDLKKIFPKENDEDELNDIFFRLTYIKNFHNLTDDKVRVRPSFYYKRDWSCCPSMLPYVP